MPEFRVLICSKCQYAVLPSEIDTHFQKKPTHGLNKTSRQRIVQAVGRIPRLIQDQKELKEFGFVFPPPTAPAIPELGEPRKDGLKCPFDKPNGKPCTFIVRYSQRIREHCREVHQQGQPKQNGPPRKEHRSPKVPWEEKVHCQRFFDHGLYSGFFEVRSQPVEPRDGPEDQARKFIQARIEKA